MNINQKLLGGVLLILSLLLFYPFPVTYVAATASPSPASEPALAPRQEIPVRAWITLSGAVASALEERPPIYWFVVGQETGLTFQAWNNQAGVLQMQLTLPAGVTLLAGETQWSGQAPEHSLSSQLRFDQPGEYRLNGPAANLSSGFQSTASVIVRVLASAEAARQDLAALCPEEGCAKTTAITGQEFVNGKLKMQPAAPEGTARIRGVAVTYPLSDGRQYPLRGLEIELWEDVLNGSDVRLGSIIHTKEATTDSDCGLTRGANYVQGNVWVNGDGSGSFDFGNIEVGASKKLYYKMIYKFYDGGDGLTNAGTLKLTIRNDAQTGDPIITQTSAPFTAYSGGTYLHFLAPPALGTLGTVVDETAHIYYDISRMYGYSRDCGNFTMSAITAYLNLPNTNGPNAPGPSINYNGATYDYLTYEFASSIIHEYAHSMHYYMRGGSYPPYDPGDRNHGSCSNVTSADALVEGWASYLPARYFDDPFYRWGSMDTPHDISSNTFPNDNCENSEWTFSAILWDLWTEVESRDNIGYEHLATTLKNHDPDLVSAFYTSFIADWGRCYATWRVFDQHNVTYATCPLPAPSALSGQAISQTQISLSWTSNSSDHTDFHVSYLRDGNTVWVLDSKQPTSPGLVSDGLDCGTTYQYRVRAHRHGDAVYSSFSNTISVSTLPCDPPGTPTGLTALAISSSQIRLSWTDNSNESDFHIERSPNGFNSWSEVATVSANVRQYTNGGLAFSTPYYYRVRAHRHSDGQYSNYSNTANATTQPLGALNAPSNLSAVPASTSQLNVSWTDNASDESDFHLETSPDGLSGWTELVIRPANTTSHNQTGLSCWQTVYYRVRAHRHTDNVYSAYSNVAQGTTNSCFFDAPYLWLESPAPQLINLQIQDNTWDESDFHIERRLDSTSSWSAYATVNGGSELYVYYSDLNINCDTYYEYRVRAHRHNDSLYSDYSPVRGFRSQPCEEAPRAPSNLTTTAESETEIILNWRDNSSDESDFHILMSLNGSTWQDLGWVEADRTWTRVSDLECGRTYYFRIRAHRYFDNASSFSIQTPGTTWPCGWNDDFWSQAYFIPALPFSRQQTVNGATIAFDDPTLPCASNEQKYRSVWYAYNATADGTLTVNTFGSNYDTILAAWSGWPLENQACNHNYNGLQSQIVFNVVKWQTYFIEVADMDPISGGALTLNAALSNAAAPLLTRLSPPWQAAGMPDFTVDIFGENFISGLSTLRWNGADRPTTFVSGTQLCATIPAADVAAVGSASLTVFSGGGGGTSNALSFQIVPPTGFDLSAGASGSPPLMDGFLTPGEWSDALAYDITAPPYTGLLAPAQPLAAVTLYIKNDASYLYLALDNPNDLASHSNDAVILYFDDDPIPADGEWGNFICGHPFGEGYFNLRPATVTFVERIAYQECSPLSNPPGVTRFFNFASGHAQVEIRIDLANSALRLQPGDTLMAWLRLVDGNSGQVQGIWPNHGRPEDPGSFRALLLSWLKLYLPLSIR